MNKKARHIFSGPNSQALWKAIHKNKETAPLVFWALYVLACRCQELEALVRKEEVG